MSSRSVATQSSAQHFGPFEISICKQVPAISHADLEGPCLGHRARSDELVFLQL